MSSTMHEAARPQPFTLTSERVLRWAGFSALLTGLIFAGIQPIHPPDVLASVTTTPFIVITLFKTLMSLFGIFGVTGLYVRQTTQLGWLGFVGYLLLIAFYAVQMCLSFTEPFILPILASRDPAFVESVLAMISGAPMSVDLGWLPLIWNVISLCYLVGLLCFGAALLRSPLHSRWAAGLLMLSGPLAIAMVTVLPHQFERWAAIPMGIALGWLGYELWAEQR